MARKPKLVVTCSYCDKSIQNKFPSHLKKYHDITEERYYLDNISPNKGRCKECNKLTNFRSWILGYTSFCSNSCIQKYNWREDLDFRRKNTDRMYGNTNMTPEISRLGQIALKKPEVVRRAHNTRVRNGSFQRTLDSAHSTASRMKATNTILKNNPRHFIEMSRTLGTNASKINYYKSIKSGLVSYRSSWEKRAYWILDNRDDVIKFEVEPFSIKYINSENKESNYWPDILVYHSDDSKSLIEIKPRFRLAEFDVKAKIDAAKIYCYNNNIKWILWSDWKDMK